MKYIVIIFTCFFLGSCNQTDSISVVEDEKYQKLRDEIVQLKYEFSDFKSGGFNETPDAVDYKLLSTIVTFLAVCVSLWLGLRDRLIRILVNLKPSDKNNDFDIIITNYGRRDVVVTDVKIYFWCFSKKYFITLEKDQYWSGLKLKDGEVKALKVECFRGYWQSIMNSFTWFEKIFIKVPFSTIIVEVSTSTSNKFYCYVPKKHSFISKK